MLVVVAVEIWLWLPVYRSKTVAWGAVFLQNRLPLSIVGPAVTGRHYLFSEYRLRLAETSCEHGFLHSPCTIFVK